MRLAYIFILSAAAYGQQAIIQVAPKPSSLSPPPPGYPPACQGGSFNFTGQTATFPYTTYCVYYKLGFTTMGGGYVNGSGSGACNAGSYCNATLGTQVNQPAPLFQGLFSDAGDGMNWNVYVNSASNTSNYNPNGNNYCGIPTVTTGAIAQARKPSCPMPPSPIVIDPTGEGFHLTDWKHGVQFRETASGPLLPLSWTDPAYHNAWLVKPNADGSVTDLASNLFGNLSPQAASDTPNGYAALAYLAVQQGCGKISKLDAKSCPAVWDMLRLWHDANQDGVAQPGELSTLEAAGVEGISLETHSSPYTDQYGNQFRFDAQTFDSQGTGNYRCYDVWLTI